MVRHALTGDGRLAEPADRVQRRHGRPAQGAADNVPNQEMLHAHLDQAADRVPDPFGTHESFAHHNNALLRQFLDRFGFDYEFLSATDCYTSGRFDEALRQVLRGYDDIMGVMLPTLREERRHLFAGAAVSAHDRPRAAGAGRGGRCRGRHHRLHRRGHGREVSSRRSAACPSCSGRSTGRCAGSRSASITRWPART
jgi:hypothetical protein